MSLKRKIERWGKRGLIRMLTTIVRSSPMTAEEVVNAGLSRILVVRQHNQMGDMLLAVPAFRAIKETFPQARVGALSSTINRDVLLNNPFIDDVFMYNRSRPLGLFRLLSSVRKARFDLVIVLHTVSFSFTSALFGLLSGARVRVGSTSEPFANPLSSSFYHLELPLPNDEELGRMNETEHNLYPLRALGIGTKDLSPLLVPSKESEAWAEEYVHSCKQPGTLLVVVHPGAGKTANVWPPVNYATVINRVAERHEISLCIIEGPRDAENVQRFQEASDVPGNVIRGRPIGDVAAVMRRADGVLCNDTGVMHVSCSVAARTIAIFGPTDPNRWAPSCRTLHVIKAPAGNLQQLTPENVFEVFWSVIESVNRTEGNRQR